MVFAGARCLKLHRIMLTIVGLWPYQKTVIWQIQAVFFFGVYCCMLFSQFTPFLTTTCTMECIIKRFTHICITFVFILLYYSFYFNSEAVKQMVEHMHFDWKMFANSDAIKIFEEYLFESYIFALSLCFLYVISAFFVAIVESKSIILDVIAPMNESRPRKLDLDIEFFVNEEQYFFFYLVQELLGLGIGTWSMLTTGTFLTTVTKHLCATYKIVSYLIQNTVTVHTLQLPIVQRIQYMNRNICLSVYIHRRTLAFCKSLVLSFDIWYFPIVFIGVLSLSGILFRLYNDIMQFDDLYDILAYFGVLVCYLLYMFMTNFLAQSYTDHSVEVLESTYDTLWYVAPLPIQKLFLIMQKSIRSHKIVVGGLFVASIEGFSTLVTSAVSYFTVMHAMRL
ncbi:hypothetical protein DMN91_006438 [Ooceraea biroi]|uniref:Odorant receptor n=1 Tax=Ooceraea biroi TaxID=2015173 RepID=A0A026X3R2_OOCBI|nr:uncharacterized protein LOC105284438 isoform X1 [Ooceraea biroi]EZA62616.1 hypothetical protein X777_07430 [Ooceraea biroi]RLU22058.1 hypothetical protein DMN91_006438 [Ooceraea biroi]